MAAEPISSLFLLKTPGGGQGPERFSESRSPPFPNGI
jgi:hypothetical protein